MAKKAKAVKSKRDISGLKTMPVRRDTYKWITKLKDTLNKNPLYRPVTYDKVINLLKENNEKEILLAEKLRMEKV